jgi:glutamine amidotransferase
VVESPNNVAALRTTHIGWRELARTPGSENHKIFHQFDFDDSLYFVHSYSVQAMDPRHTLATVDYGGREVTAVVAADSVVGVQFHPEKSGSAGLKILENFLAI